MSEPSSERRQLVARLAPIAAVAGVAAALFAQTRHYALLGWDSYPIVLTSRVLSWADFVGNFTERLMDGLYSDLYYRPLVNLTFAADYAAWGLEPSGYQLTNVVLFALCALMVHVLARRLLSGAAWFGSWLALLAFLFSPLLFEVLPVPARRAEMLCCLFMLIALASQLRPAALAAIRPPALPAIATLAAIASKESALVLPALVFIAVWAYSPRKGAADRLRHAASCTVPHGAALALMLGARFMVLGGLGGHSEAGLFEALRTTPRAVLRLAEGLILPQSFMQGPGLGRWLVTIFVLCLALTAILQLLRAPGGKDQAELPQAIEAMLVAGAWSLIFGVLYAAVGLIGPWYFFLPIAGWAIFAGALAETLLAFRRQAGLAGRIGAGVTLALLLAVLIWHARYSPVIYRYDEWQQATELSDEFMESALADIDRALDGRYIEGPILPYWVPAKVSGPTINGGATLADYSAAAWIAMARPERKIRMRLADGTIELDPQGLLVLLPVITNFPEPTSVTDPP